MMAADNVLEIKLNCHKAVPTNFYLDKHKMKVMNLSYNFH